MFSGISNQVSSWMGSVKGESEEKVPTPTGDNNALLNQDAKDVSPTKNPPTSATAASAAGGGGGGAGHRMEMFSNVKSQIGGLGEWLGSSIPKLRKGEHGETAGGNPDATGVENPAVDAGSPVGGNPVKEIRDDDDNSSATGGADSGPQSLRESPTEENKDGQFGNVQSKAIAGAKSFGSFLYSAVNKAGKTVTEAGSKIHINTIFGEFNKEQEAFVKNKNNSTVNAVPPWIGYVNEEALKEECLNLSNDRRNFVKAPPAGCDFVFDYEASYPVAMAIMEQDPKLEKMRYELVPKIIAEEDFWKNYFYRIHLICQASELAYDKSSNTDAADDTSSIQPIDKIEKDHEFVSDTLIASKDLEPVPENKKRHTVGFKIEDGIETEWEKELEAELQDYELVDDTNSNNCFNSNNLHSILSKTSRI